MKKDIEALHRQLAIFGQMLANTIPNSNNVTKPQLHKAAQDLQDVSEDFIKNLEWVKEFLR